MPVASPVDVSTMSRTAAPGRLAVSDGGDAMLSTAERVPRAGQRLYNFFPRPSKESEAVLPASSSSAAAVELRLSPSRHPRGQGPRTSQPATLCRIWAAHVRSDSSQGLKGWTVNEMPSTPNLGQGLQGASSASRLGSPERRRVPAATRLHILAPYGRHRWCCATGGHSGAAFFEEYAASASLRS